MSKPVDKHEDGDDVKGPNIPYGPERKPWKKTIEREYRQFVSPPSQDPAKAYDHGDIERGITPAYYQVTAEGFTCDEYRQAQDETKAKTDQLTANFLGYQVTLGNDYSVISKYLQTSVNNVGDPFSPGSYLLNTKWMERNVLDYYACLWNAKWPHDKNDPETYWGYVLSMGGSEGNLYGLWNGRDYLQGKFMMTDKSGKDSVTTYVQALPPKKNENAYTPVLFYSEDTHYSITKSSAALEIATFYSIGVTKYPGQCPLDGDWPREVPSEGGDSGPGSIDIDALCKLVEFFASKGYPCLFVFNYGSTFKGAYDNVAEAGRKLMPILKRYGLKEREIDVTNPDTGEVIKKTRRGYWFHVDGALGASYMPFLKMAFHEKLTDVPAAPDFDFKLPFVCSINCSGHKWPGSPVPTGIYMTRTGLQMLPPSDPEYIGSPDTTFAGSRSGISPIIWWTYISTHSYKAQIKKIVDCLKLTFYLYGKLKALEETIHPNIWSTYTMLTLSVRCKKPKDEIVQKYTLAIEELMYQGEKRTYVHIYLMGGTSRETVDAMLEDLKQPDAFTDTRKPFPKPAARVRDPKDLSEGILVDEKSKGFLKGVKPIIPWPTHDRGWK